MLQGSLLRCPATCVMLLFNATSVMLPCTGTCVKLG